MRLGTALVAALLLPAALAGGAQAAWSSSATGTGRSTAATLPTPASVASACAGNDDVRITWDAASDHVASFVAQRSADAGVTWADVATLTPGSASSHAFDDLDLPPGSYIHRIRTVTGGWSTLSAASPTRVLVEVKGKKPRPVTCS